MQNLEQLKAIKFCVKPDNNGVDMLKMLRQVFGEDAMSQNWTLEWHKRFQEGRETVNNKEHSGCLSTTKTNNTVQKVGQLLDSDWWMNVQMLAEERGVLKSVVHLILTEDFDTRKVCAKMVPKVLTDDTKKPWKNTTMGFWRG